MGSGLRLRLLTPHGSPILGEIARVYCRYFRESALSSLAASVGSALNPPELGDCRLGQRPWLRASWRYWVDPARLLWMCRYPGWAAVPQVALDDRSVEIWIDSVLLRGLSEVKSTLWAPARQSIGSPFTSELILPKLFLTTERRAHLPRRVSDGDAQKAHAMGG